MKNITQFKLYIHGAIAVLNEELKKLEISEKDEGLEEAGVVLAKAKENLKKYLDYNF